MADSIYFVVRSSDNIVINRIVVNDADADSFVYSPDFESFLVKDDDTVIENNYDDQLEPEMKYTVVGSQKYVESVNCQYASWSKDANGIWQPPLPRPENTETVFYFWDEEAHQADNTTGWIADNTLENL